MRRQLVPAIVSMVILTVLFGLLYPLVVTGVAQVAFKAKADGSKVCDPNTVPQRAKAYRKLNGLSATTKIPVDAVTASGSGLDPDISVANARLQAPRVARARGLSKAKVLQLVDDHTDARP